jgi:LuxR family maltose regulon positive regulatory protein
VREKEKELLDALDERGELTPTTAAMRTSLTVDEASTMLDELVRKGHLETRTEEGIVAYALSEPNTQESKGQDPVALRAGSGSNGASLRLEDPLSERELEVLGLLASGKTNSEVAGDLFVSVGTVKSHTGNIYRKLGARNRTEALSRARGLGLIQ